LKVGVILCPLNLKRAVGKLGLNCTKTEKINIGPVCSCKVKLFGGATVGAPYLPTTTLTNVTITVTVSHQLQILFLE